MSATKEKIKAKVLWRLNKDGLIKIAKEVGVEESEENLRKLTLFDLRKLIRYKMNPRDRFGSIRGTLSSRINEALSEDWKTLEEIAEGAGVPPHKARGRLYYAVRKGWVEYRRLIQFRWSPEYLEKLKQMEELKSVGSIIEKEEEEDQSTPQEPAGNENESIKSEVLEESTEEEPEQLEEEASSEEPIGEDVEEFEEAEEEESEEEEEEEIGDEDLEEVDEEIEEELAELEEEEEEEE